MIHFNSKIDIIKERHSIMYQTKSNNYRRRIYFSSFIISSVKGVVKPHQLMYKAALDELNVSLDEAIFIDDSIKNWDGVRKSY